MFMNTAPCLTQVSCTSRAAAVLNNGGWRFPIRHLCRTEDHTANNPPYPPNGAYNCEWILDQLGPTGTFTVAGHPSQVWQRPGTHYENGASGTWAGWNSDIRPELRKTTWHSP